MVETQIRMQNRHWNRIVYINDFTASKLEGGGGEGLCGRTTKKERTFLWPPLGN